MYTYIYIYIHIYFLHLNVTVLILCSGSTGSHLETFIMDKQEVKDQDTEHKKIIDNRLRPGSTCVFARGGSLREDVILIHRSADVELVRVDVVVLGCSGLIRITFRGVPTGR